MKRIIYSIYTNNIDVESSHSSSTDYKKSQFEKWKDHIEANHKKYAFLCDADYHLHTTKTTSYHQIQFEMNHLSSKRVPIFFNALPSAMMFPRFRFFS